MKTLRFFDFEVLPHWWCCTFGDIDIDIDIDIDCVSIDEDIKETFKVVTSDDTCARDDLMNLIREKEVCLCGYNIKKYDLIIANAIYQGFTPEQVKIINDMIINPGCAWETKEHIRLQPFTKKRLSGICYQDLLDDGAGSLKEKEAIMGLNILESSVDFNQEILSDADKQELIYYNKQDVYATMYFYLDVAKEYVKTKLALGRKFNIPEDVCFKSTNAKLVSLALGASKSAFADEERKDIVLPSKIRQYCYDNLPNKILERIATNPEGFTVKLFDNNVSFGNGGMHSTYIGTFNTEPCLYVESNDDWVLVNVDASSYYPSEMIQFNLLSRAVNNRQHFIDIFEERIAIKNKPDKTPEDDAAQKADKLVLNTTFGASGNEYLELYDPYMCTSVCRVGQIFLASLACKIVKTINSAKIIQTNTDGIACYLLRKDLPILQNLMKEWSTISGINMELDTCLKLWQRDVNNYLMLIEEKGKQKIKSKGAWLNTTYHRPGSMKTANASAFVCSKAAQEFLINGTDIIRTIVADKDIKDFIIICTKGPTYRGVIQKFADGTEKELFKANRVIASKDENKGELFKYKMFKGERRLAKMPSIPEHCLTVNDDLSTYQLSDIKELDYVYYIMRAIDMLSMAWFTFNNGNIIQTHQFDIE